MGSHGSDRRGWGGRCQSWKVWEGWKEREGFLWYSWVQILRRTHGDVVVAGFVVEAGYWRVCGSEGEGM